MSENDVTQKNKKIKTRRPRRRLYEPITEDKQPQQPLETTPTEEAQEPPMAEGSLAAINTLSSQGETYSSSIGLLTETTAMTVEGSNGSSLAIVKDSLTLREANEIVKQYSRWSAGSALIPIPIVDMIAAAGIEIAMIKSLCSLYGREFSSERVKTIIAALTGGLHVGVFARILMQGFPLFGLPFAVASSIAASGAITYAIGKVFVMHFEAGGTILNLNPEEMRSYFASILKKQKGS